MAKGSIDYHKKIEQMLMEMPDFVSDFIYNFGQVEKTATKFQYCRDIRDFLNFMVNFMPEHDGKSIRELTRDDIAGVEPLYINRYLTMLSGKGDSGLKLSTVKRRRASLSSMYGFFVVNGKMNANPVASTRPIRLPEKSLIYLNNDEQLSLLNTVRYGTNLPDKTLKRHKTFAERDSAMFLLLLDTGLRVSEMLDTDIKDFSIEDCSVLVTRKGGDHEFVYYSDECAGCLQEYFESQRLKYAIKDDDFPAFTPSTGVRLGVRAVETLVKKYVRACFPDKESLMSPHKLRSSFAMSFYEASDRDILLLQKKLHHKSITTTNIYAKASDKASAESRNLLQGVRNRNS